MSMSSLVYVSMGGELSPHGEGFCSMMREASVPKNRRRVMRYVTGRDRRMILCEDFELRFGAGWIVVSWWRFHPACCVCACVRDDSCWESGVRGHAPVRSLNQILVV